MRIIPLPQESVVHRYILHTFHHSTNVKDARCASGCIGAIGWTSSSSYHVANATANRVHVLLRGYHVYVCIKMSRCTYCMLASSSLSTGRDHKVRRYLVHRIWIACTPNSSNLPVLYADITLDYSYYRIENNSICDNVIKGSICICNTGCLCQSIPYCLSSAKNNFISGVYKIPLYFYH